MWFCSCFVQGSSTSFNQKSAFLRGSKTYKVLTLDLVNDNRYIAEEVNRLQTLPQVAPMKIHSLQQGSASLGNVEGRASEDTRSSPVKE